MIFTALSPASTALSSARGLRRQQRQARRPAAAARPCAAATPGPQEEVQESQQLFENLATELERSTRMMLARYDFLSAGLGALAVTTFCVARGQDPQTALWITFASTVVALLLNELLFNDETKH